jgi:serine/threonine protein kinase
VAHRGQVESSLGMLAPVLVKSFDAVPTDDPEGFVKGLAEAASRAALVKHPNVADVYECGIDSGRVFLLTEDVPGVSLAAFVERLAETGARLTFDVALFVGCEVAEALTAAFAARDHEGRRARVLHGDLSARQVLLGFSGAVKVTDFEIGRIASGQSGIRSLRTVASRLDMLAPELVRGEPSSPRTDVFALGMLLRTMLVGPRFPAGISHSEALRMVREGEVHCPTFHTRIPAELAELVLTATAVQVEDRFPNVRVLAWELRRIAFAHGVGDARPFLARALERAFPERATSFDDEDELDDSDFEVFDDDFAELEEDDRDANVARDAYDSEYPPPRAPSAPAIRARERSPFDAEPANDFEHDEAFAYTPTGKLSFAPLPGPNGPASQVDVYASTAEDPSLHDDQEEREPPSLGPESYEPETVAPERISAFRAADDLAETQMREALRPPKTPTGLHGLADLLERASTDDDLDPECTVNLKG